MDRLSSRKIAIISISAPVVVIALVFLIYNSVDLEDEGHYDREETELIVVNTANVLITLHKAGSDIDSSAQVDSFDGSRMWLPKGDYFLRAEYGDFATYYPVNIFGYRFGPERDGSLAITIRPGPDSMPPSPQKELAEFKFIPSGYFLMGDRLNPNEPHYVWTQAFFIGEFEVTNAEFTEFLQAPDGYGSDSNWSEGGTRWKRQRQTLASAELHPADENFGRFGKPDMPVTQVNWFEANAYCRWLTKRYGGARWLFSLPSEAEWEKAARGPDGFDYPLARSLSDNETALYNWKKNPSALRTVFGNYESRTMYKPNRWGIYNMGGSVVEWTQSIYLPLTRQRPYEDDDRNREDRPGSRVARGGSWYSASAALLYIPYRDAFEPELTHNDLGFRVVAKLIPD